MAHRLENRLAAAERRAGSGWLPILQTHPSAWPSHLGDAIARGDEGFQAALPRLSDERLGALLAEVRAEIAAKEAAL